MKREAGLFLKKACESLVLSIEVCNRPHDIGRVTSTLILLDHAFEMFLKAAILQRGGPIREKRDKETIGFDACVRRGLTNAKVKFLSDEQALVLQTINGLRNAAQHDLLEISEGQLYIHCQAGVTLFRDLLKEVFNQDLIDCLPERVLPISILPPTDLVTLFDTEINEIIKLLRPRKRRRIDAKARLRPLVILDTAIMGKKGQPSSKELDGIAKELLKGKNWQEIFLGVSAIEISPNGTGPSLSLRLTKKEGVPVYLVPEGTPGASVLAVKRVNELDYYNLGRDQLANHIGLTGPKTSALIWYTKLQSNTEYYKEIIVGKSRFKRYSQKAIEVLKKSKEESSMDDVWEQYINAHKKVK